MQYILPITAIFTIFLYITFPIIGMEIEESDTDITFIHLSLTPNQQTKFVTIDEAKELYPNFRFSSNDYVRMIPISATTSSGTMNVLVPYDHLLKKTWNIQIHAKNGKIFFHKNFLNYEYPHKNKLLQEITNHINKEHIELLKKYAELITEHSGLKIVSTILIAQGIELENEIDALKKRNKELQENINLMELADKINKKFIEQQDKSVQECVSKSKNLIKDLEDELWNIRSENLELKNQKNNTEVTPSYKPYYTSLFGKREDAFLIACSISFLTPILIYYICFYVLQLHL